MSHCDPSELNILCSFNQDGEVKLTLVDYEFGIWNPRYYDIAAYINEMVCDNAHPSPKKLAYFFANWATEDELISLARQYW